jgi:muramoyltetrapeptide carboxypeptidase
MTERMPHSVPIRPPALLPGDTVGIVAPASNIDPKALAAGCAALRKLGYVPYYLDSIFERDLFFAGSVARRVGELEHMFANPEVRAIVCARGGYGTNHLLPHLDLRVLLANPKPFIGYSDITTLLTWLTDHGLVTFHGPMVTKDFALDNGVDLTSWAAILSSASAYERDFSANEIEVLVKGEAEGILYGGCLSMLAASLGTPYEIHTDGTILFLEDINAKPFQVDRMVMQLKLAGKFTDVRGVIFGEMLDCSQPSGQDYTLQEIILRLLSDLRIPIAYGFSSGHVRCANRLLPFGVRGRLTVNDNLRLECDAAVTQGEGIPRAIQGQSGR